MTDYQQTHWDILDAGRVCHDECAVAQIKAAALAMRERCAVACEELSVDWFPRFPRDKHDAAREGAIMRCAAAIRALEA